MVAYFRHSPQSRNPKSIAMGGGVGVAINMAAYGIVGGAVTSTAIGFMLPKLIDCENARNLLAVVVIPPAIPALIGIPCTVSRWLKYKFTNGTKAENRGRRLRYEDARDATILSVAILFVPSWWAAHVARECSSLR